MGPHSPWLAYPINKKEHEVLSSFELPKWCWLSRECYMGRGLGVGGALGTVGILQTYVRQAKNLPVVLKTIPI